MMGLPQGWVCDSIEGRTHQLRILGNGVVPLQAAHALGVLVEQMKTFEETS
jgi:DNA (cytosine-5)-methyltransferase 1